MRGREKDGARAGKREMSPKGRISSPPPPKTPTKLTFEKNQINGHGDDINGHEAEHDAQFVPDRRRRVEGNLGALVFDHLCTLFRFSSGSEVEFGKGWDGDCKRCGRFAVPKNPLVTRQPFSTEPLVFQLTLTRLSSKG